ncbi:MAG: shikimate dehydrogenase [Candidatus Omnitrophica bacterium]|nr:shikimate dehydrogenase [Candidatus Omnitrophota bacterium]MDD5574370.1 shikimate dehydrogenase [Candidatus Omnitrophota bacterium]
MTPHTPKELYGLIGRPVKHSYSALMHNAAFKHYGMDAVYELFEVAPQELETFFKKTVLEKKIKGFNVTVPHKEAALKYLSGTVSVGVKMIGAVNTVCVRQDGQFDGFNTDEMGFVKDVESEGVVIHGKTAALIGAGGGARAVAFGLAAQQALEIRIFDMDRSKAEKLAADIGQYYSNASPVSSFEKLDIPDADILVNATPVGMKPEDSLLVKQEWLKAGQFVYDLIYNPAETKLLATAKAAGCRTANGLGMLLYQGALAFEHWTGKAAPMDAMRKALSERIHA